MLTFTLHISSDTNKPAYLSPSYSGRGSTRSDSRGGPVPPLATPLAPHLLNGKTIMNNCKLKWHRQVSVSSSSERSGETQARWKKTEQKLWSDIKTALQKVKLYLTKNQGYGRPVFLNSQPTEWLLRNFQRYYCQILSTSLWARRRSSSTRIQLSSVTHETETAWTRSRLTFIQKLFQWEELRWDLAAFPAAVWSCEAKSKSSPENGEFIQSGARRVDVVALGNLSIDCYALF